MTLGVSFLPNRWPLVVSELLLLYGVRAASRVKLLCNVLTSWKGL